MPIERHGKNTMLYNSIYDSIDLLVKAKADTKSIIIFTDGKTQMLQEFESWQDEIMIDMLKKI